MLPITVLGVGWPPEQSVALNQMLTVNGEVPPACDAGEYPTSPVATVHLTRPEPTMSTVGTTATRCGEWAAAVASEPLMAVAAMTTAPAVLSSSFAPWRRMTPCLSVTALPRMFIGGSLPLAAAKPRSWLAPAPPAHRPADSQVPSVAAGRLPPLPQPWPAGKRVT